MAKSKKVAVSIDYEPKVTDVAEYNKVVAGAQLVTIQLMKSAFDVDSDYFSPDRKPTLHFDRGLEGCVFDVEDRTVAGWFKFEVQAKVGRKAVLKGSAVYMVVYSLNFDADEVAAKTYCERIGTFAAFPYFRSHTAHLAWEANVRLPPLPTIATKGAPVKALQPDGMK